MVNAVIENLSNFSRDHWVTVTFPTKKVQDFGTECRFTTEGGSIWRAVKGKQSGNKTVFRIYAEIGGGETVKGMLQNKPFTPEDKIPAFKAHAWVMDDPMELMPELYGMDCEIVSPPKIVDKSPAHMRWHMRMKVPTHGLIFEWWADLLHDDPVVPCKGKIVWSDRNDTRVNRTFDVGEFKLAVGEFFVMDFEKRKGIQPPIQVDPSRWVSVINDKLVTLNDGAGIPLSLNLLAFTRQEMTDQDPEDISWVSKSLQNMQAAFLGDIVGACTEWDGEWCAADNVPVSYPGSYYDAMSDVQMFRDQMSVNMGHFEPIWVGIGKTPGQTGAQEDFAATKGTHVVLSQQPAFIPALQFASYYELFRGINHYESNGEPLKADDHPNWITWNGVTHWHGGVSPDRLGKEGSAPPGTGWFGYDDQHRSQNNFAAYAMLSDDPLIDDQIDRQFEVDKACYRIKNSRWGAGAARAQGRHTGAWAQFLTVTEGARREGWKDLIDKRVNLSLSQTSMNVNGDMKALSVKGPDGRKQIYRNGELAPTVSMWEHGLAMVGLYNTYKQNPTEELKELLTKVANTMLKYAWFNQNGKNYVVADIIWNDGNDVEMKTSNTQEIIFTEGGSGVTTWTIHGLRAAREFMQWSDSNLNKLLGGDPGNQGAVEWHAVAKS